MLKQTWIKTLVPLWQMKTLNILNYSFHQLLNQVVDEQEERMQVREERKVGKEPLVTDKTRMKDVRKQ